MQYVDFFSSEYTFIKRIDIFPMRRFLSSDESFI